MIAVAEERQRMIGQELHDNLGQQIAAIAYQAQALEHKIAASGNKEAAKIAASIATQAQNSVLQCKHLARGMLTLELEADSLADAVVRLLQSPDAATPMGEAGRAYVRRAHDWSVAASQLEQVYASLSPLSQKASACV